MDESTVELDSFTADMLRRVKEHKMHLDNLMNDDDDAVSQEGNENEEKSDSEEEEEEVAADDKDLEADFDELLMNDNYKAHVRKSISVLLNVRESVLPESEDEVDSVSAKPASRLNQRLDKLSNLYSDSDVVPNRVLTENKVNIAKERKEDVEDKPKLRLKDKLNDIARFYYPVQDEEVASKPKTLVKSSQASELKVYGKSESSVTSKPKVLNMIHRIKSQEIVQQPSISNKSPCPPPPPQPSVLSKPAISSVDTKKPEAILTKKTSVANLKKMFEGKAQEETQTKKEAAPELLSLRDKRRLFEKAIREESEASKSQYRKLPLPPPKRIANWEPIPLEECDLKRPKSTPDNTESTTASALNSDTPLQEVVGADTLDKYKSEFMSICSDNNSEILLAKEEQSDEQIEDEQETTSDANDHFDHQVEQVHQGSLGELLKVAAVTVEDCVEKAFESIDNYSMSDREESNIDTIADITFSALDANNDQLQRSSTKVDLKSDSQSTNSSQPSSSQMGPPEKPERLYLYENDEPEINAAPTEELPPLRTISFYRREQKMRKETCDSPIPGTSGVIHLKQKLHENASAKLEEFNRTCNDRIVLLKKEISEHNRISGQASTALNMCLTHHDLEFNDGRIEAERLLLIADEKRKACTAEIQRLKNMLMNPEKFSSQLSNVSSKGMVSISNLRIPLRNEFVDLRAKGKATSTYYFICLVFNGPKVFVSELLNTAKNIGQDYLEFKFNLHCQELNDDFAVRVQLFSLELHKDKSKKDTLGRKSFRIKFGTSSLKRADKGSVNSPIPHKITSQLTSFKSVGHITLNLASVRNPPSFYRMESLQMMTPVDGYIIMDVSLRVNHNLSAEGFFDLQDNETSFWNLRWFVLKGSKLMYWRFADEAKDKQPLGVINLKHCINPTLALLKGEQRKLCMRPYTFTLVNIKPPAVSNAHKLVNGGKIVRNIPEKFFISSQSREDSQIFCDQIGKVLRNIRIWENDAVHPYSADEFNRLLLSNHF